LSTDLWRPQFRRTGWHFSLRILTSSHKFWPSRSPTIFMVSSRDRRFVSVEGCLVRATARTPPPAFLFPIQRCQRPDRLSPTPLFCAGGRRRRLSSGRPRTCQSVPSDVPAATPNLRRSPGIWRKNHTGLRRGNPQKSVSIRLRLGKIPIQRRNARGFSSPAGSPRTSPARAGGAI
jgi:hypothetical protein